MSIDELSVKGYTISPQLFTHGFPDGRGPCACTSFCCRGGVYADVTERDRILQLKETIKKYMDVTQTKDDAMWFEQEEQEDGDFASGRCVGTNVHNDKCVFQDARGWCSIQVAASSEGLHKWAWKPLYCVLYPIEVTDRVIGFDDMLQGEQNCCSIEGRFETPVFEACREELTYLLGETGFEELRRHYMTLENMDRNPNI